MRSLSTLLLLCSSSLFAQNTFQRVFDCDRGNMSAVMPITGGGTYVTYGVDEFDVLGTRSGTGVVKYDANFNPVWTNVYATPNMGQLSGLGSAVATSDGGIALAGAALVIVTDTAMIMKLSSGGAVLWAKFFPSPLPEGAVDDSFSRIMDIKEAPNGDLVVVGDYSYYTDDYFTRLFVARLSSSGTVLWTKSLAPATDAANWNTAASLSVLSGGGLLITGSTEVEGAWMAHLQDNGTLDWVKKFSTTGGPSDLRPVRAFKTASGYDYFLSPGYGANSSVMCLIRTDANGVYTSSKVYTLTGGTGSTWDVMSTASGYAVTGFTGYLTPETYDQNMLLFTLNATGAVQGAASFGSPDYESAQHLTALPDGGYLLAGSANYNDLDAHRGGTPPRPMMIRTDASFSYLCGAAIEVTGSDTTFTGSAFTMQPANETGWSTATVQSYSWLTSVTVCGPNGIAEENTSPISVQPNPASSAFTVITNDQAVRSYELWDAQGRLVRSMNKVQGNVIFQVDDLAPERYLLRSVTATDVRVTPVMVVR